MHVACGNLCYTVCFFGPLLHFSVFYSAPVGERSIAICLCVCLSVYPQAYLWNHWTNLHEIFCADPRGRGSIIFWLRCDTLCTSAFMDTSCLAVVGRMAMRGRLNF